tara:strand:- start:1486 stop:1827 length:342 start_codon:yes stop_codon:yes gene_type:complete
MANKKNGALPDPMVTGIIGFAIVMIILRLKHEGKKMKGAKPTASLGGMVEKHHGYQTWVVNVPSLKNGGASLFEVRASTEAEAQEQARHILHTKALPRYTIVVPKYVWEQARQ